MTASANPTPLAGSPAKKRKRSRPSQAVIGDNVTVGKWKWAVTADGTLSTATNHLALILALYFDKDGTCKPQYAPGVTALAQRSRRNRHTVMDALHELVDKGWLRIERPGKAKAIAALYRLTQPVPREEPTGAPLGTSDESQPVPLLTPTGASPDHNRCLGEHPYTTQPPDQREGGGGGGPHASAPASRAEGGAPVETEAAMTSVVAELPDKAELQAHIVAPAVQAAIASGATIEQIVGVTTTDLPRRPRSWTGLIVSRLKGAKDWIPAPDPTAADREEVAELRRQFDEMVGQLDDKTYDAGFAELQRAGLVTDDRDVTDEDNLDATPVDMRRAIFYMAKCHQKSLESRAQAERDELIRHYEEQSRQLFGKLDAFGRDAAVEARGWLANEMRSAELLDEHGRELWHTKARVRLGVDHVQRATDIMAECWRRFAPEVQCRKCGDLYKFNSTCPKCAADVCRNCGQPAGVASGWCDDDACALF